MNVTKMPILFLDEKGHLHIERGAFDFSDEAEWQEGDLPLSGKVEAWAIAEVNERIAGPLAPAHTTTEGEKG